MPDPATHHSPSTLIRRSARPAGLAKEGARHHGYTGARGYHPLLAVVAGTGDVLLARLREGRANTARGAARFLRETVGRVRLLRSQGPTHGAGRQRLLYPRRGRRLPIEAIPEDAWTPIPYCMDGAADVAETTYTPFQAEADAAPVRLIVRRVKPAPGSQLALFATYSYHGFITDRTGRPWNWRPIIAVTPRSRMRYATSSTAWGLNHLPSGRFAANGAWLAVQVMAHNLARWTARIGLGQQIVTTKTLRRRVLALAGRITRSARRLTLHLPRRWPWEEAVQPRPGPTASHSTPSLTAPIRHRPTSQPNVPANSRQPSPRAPLAVSYPPISLTTATVGRHRCPQKRLQTARNLPSTQIRARIIAPVTPSPPSAVLTPSIPVHRWIRAKVTRVTETTSEQRSLQIGLPLCCRP